MRLFCGFAISYEVRRNIELLLAHLRPAARIRWSPADNLHITTKFIGEFPRERVAVLTGALQAIGRPAPLHLSIRGLGWFPNPHQPRLLFAGVEASAELSAFFERLNDGLAELGVARETKPYHPHLTLARIPPAVEKAELGALRRAIAELPSAEFGAFVAAKHLLYESTMSADGSQYRVEAEYPL
jgi:2'-5' RNA ligase